MVILVKRRPLSRQQFLALRQRILRKDAPLVGSETSDTSELKDVTNQNDDKTESNSTPTAEETPQNDDTQLLQEQEEKCSKLREERNEISRQLASLESKLSALKEEKHHLFQQLKQALHEDELKRQLQHDQKIREQQQQTAIEAPPTNLPQQQPQPLLSQLQDQHQKQQQQPSRLPQDQQQKLVAIPTGVKRPRNDSDELVGSYDYMSPQPHKRPPLLSNPPMMPYHPQGFPQQQQQPNFNNAPFSKANSFQGFEPHPQQPFHAMDMPYQQPRFPMPEPNHMIAGQSDQRFVFQGRPPLNSEMSENYRPQFTNQVHHGGQQMEFGNQGYNQEFSSSQQQQQSHLMGFTSSRSGGYKHSLLEHTTTGSNCSSPSSLQSPITNLSMPTPASGAPFSPHEPSPVFQMGVAAAPPFSHDQQQKTSNKQQRSTL